MPHRSSRSRSASTQPQYARLEPRVTHISENRIRKKWKPLPPASQDRVRQLVLSVKAESRARRRGDGRGGGKKLDLNGHEWDTVVDTLVERLTTRLPRLPFPPTSTSLQSDLDFDFESTLTRVATLQAQLSSNAQSCKLLRTQIAREERMLRRDRRELEQLEEGVRNSRVNARAQEGRLHAVARGVGMDENGDLLRQKEDREGGRGWEEVVDEIEGRRTKQRRKGNVALMQREMEQDDRLRPLVEQLRNHLGSMKSNVAALGPVKEALDEAQDATNRFMWDGLRREEYQRVVGITV